MGINDRRERRRALTVAVGFSRGYGSEQWLLALFDPDLILQRNNEQHSVDSERFIVATEHHCTIGEVSNSSNLFIVIFLICLRYVAG